MFNTDMGVTSQFAIWKNGDFAPEEGSAGSQHRRTEKMSEKTAVSSVIISEKDKITHFQFIKVCYLKTPPHA